MFGRGLGFIKLPRYCEGGLGDVAEETDDESYDLLERLGDRGYALCDGVAMVRKGFEDQSSAG